MSNAEPKYKKGEIVIYLSDVYKVPDEYKMTAGDYTVEFKDAKYNRDHDNFVWRASDAKRNIIIIDIYSKAEALKEFGCEEFYYMLDYEFFNYKRQKWAKNTNEFIIVPESRLRTSRATKIKGLLKI